MKLALVFVLLATAAGFPVAAEADMFPTDAARLPTDFQLKVCGLFLWFFEWLRGAVYVLAAISLALMSFQASVLGAFAWSRLFSWGGSLFVLSAMPSVLAYLTNGALSGFCSPSLA